MCVCVCVHSDIHSNTSPNFLFVLTKQVKTSVSCWTKRSFGLSLLTDQAFSVKLNLDYVSTHALTAVLRCMLVNKKTTSKTLQQHPTTRKGPCVSVQFLPKFKEAKGNCSRTGGTLVFLKLPDPIGLPDLMETLVGLVTTRRFKLLFFGGVGDV